MHKLDQGGILISNYKEIVTKAVVSKGKKLFTSNHSIVSECVPSTVLGCWVINHNFNGIKNGNDIIIEGSYDVNIWYSYDNDTKTEVLKDTNSYREVVHMRNRDSSDDEEIIIRSLKQPNCVKVDIDGNNILYTIEKELGIELVDNIKVKIQVDDLEDAWDEIVEESNSCNDIDNVNDSFLNEEI